MPNPRFTSREEYLAWRRARSAGAPPSPHRIGRHPEPSTAPQATSRQGLRRTFTGLPGWAWLFIAGCLALPVATLGGALPGALGLGGAAGCAKVAGKAGWEVLPRVTACAAITGGVWLLLIAFAFAVASL